MLGVFSDFLTCITSSIVSFDVNRKGRIFYNRLWNCNIIKFSRFMSEDIAAPQY